MSTGLSIVLLAGWGALLMAMAIRAFEWLRVRGAGKSGGGVGLVRLLLAVASFLLVAWGAGLIASLLHYSTEKGVLIALVAAGAVLAYRGVRDARRNIASTRRPPASELGRALLSQVALLPLYGFYGWYYAAAASPSSPAWWFYALMGSMWVLVTLLFVVWWTEGRHRLVRGAVIWGLLAWATLALPLLLPWERSRRLLVPAPPDCVSSAP